MRLPQDSKTSEIPQTPQKKRYIRLVFNHIGLKGVVNDLENLHPTGLWEIDDYIRKALWNAKLALRDIEKEINKQ